MVKKRKKSDGNAKLVIVGIGASAGGLQAMEEFFTAMPSDSGLAFVVVQHLSPDHPSQLTNILAHYTSMPVYEIEDQQKTKSNTVYVIPPKRSLSIQSGKLLLIENEDSRTAPARIDSFFRALAEDQGETTVGIILSGSGTDGKSGLSSIKQHGGMTMAQAPDTAQYPSMAQHSINNGVVDLVASASDLPALLLDYIRNARTLPTLEDNEEQSDTEYIKPILKLLLHHTGHDFSLYKTNTISRRIARRMILSKIDTLKAYADYLQQSPGELNLLFKEFLIGVTQFFRDSFAFDTIRDKVLPGLLEDAGTDQSIRVWVSGCSTGEEAYSLAMMLHDFLGADITENKLQIFATDINPDAIKFARRGRYPAIIAKDVPPDYINRYFVSVDGEYQIKSGIRKLITFAAHDILRDPPYSNLNLVSCRNLLIYFKPETQQRVFTIFHYALKINGFLFLGTSEALGSARDSWQFFDRQAKIFRMHDTKTAPTRTFEAPPGKHKLTERNSEVIGMPNKKTDIPSLVEKFLLEDFVSPCVITNKSGEILYFHNRTGKYLEPAAGEAKLNVLHMARQGLQMALTTAFYKAASDDIDILYENLEIVNNGGIQKIHLMIRPIQEPPALKGLMLVMFKDAQHAQLEQIDLSDPDSTDAKGQRVIKLERELQTTQEFLQTTTEELETSNEELKSTNEELQSANEELQSTNEELETSKEEVNSVNEELISANSELQSKIEGLSRANNDLQNLLNSIESGIIFLDNQLNIQRFNPASKRVFNLIESDIGRSITHITSKFEQANFIEDMQAVLADLVPYTSEISTSDDVWYMMQIRPYRTIDNVIDGVVVTFNDITQQKQAQDELQNLASDLSDAHNYTEMIINTMRHPLLVLGNDLTVISTNRSFFQVFQANPEETIGVKLFDLGNGQWNILKLNELLDSIVAEDTVFENFLVEHEFPLIGPKKFILDARRLKRQGNKDFLILLAIEEFTTQIN